MKLPRKVIIQKKDILVDNYDNEEELVEVINNYLSDNYGYCMHDYELKITPRTIVVSRICWDTNWA